MSVRAVKVDSDFLYFTLEHYIQCFLLCLPFFLSFQSVHSPFLSQVNHHLDKTVQCTLLEGDFQRLIQLLSDVIMRENSAPKTPKSTGLIWCIADLSDNDDS